MNSFFKTLNKEDVLVLVLWMRHPVLSYLGLLLGFAVPFLRTAFIPLVVIASVVYSFNAVIGHIKISDIVFYIICILISILSYLNPNNNEALDSILPIFIFETLPFFFVGISADLKKLEKPLYIISLISIIAQASFSFIYMRSRYGDMMSAESMSYSYWILPHVLMLIRAAFKRPNIVNVSIALLGFFLVVSYGSRGPVLCCLIFIICNVYLLISDRNNKKALIFLIPLALLVVFKSSAIFDLFSSGIESLGMSNRIINFIGNDDVTNDSGRGFMYERCINALNEGNAILGFGLCGDRYFCSGAYVHNIFIEFWMAFGYLFGSLLLLLYLNKIRVGIKAAKDPDSCSFLFLLCALTCELLVSDSFVTSESFFYALGFAIALKRNREQTLLSNSSL